MKLSAHLARLKLKKIQAAEPKPAQGNRGKGALKDWAALIICLLFLGGGTWAVLAIFVWDTLPAALIGTWEVQDGPMKGGTFEFARDGTLEIRANEGTQIKARATVAGKTLVQTTQHPTTKRDETHKSTIQELTANTLVLELDRGTVLRMARAK